MGIAFGVLGVPWAASGGFGQSLVVIGYLEGSLGGPRLVFIDLGCHFGRLGASALNKMIALGFNLSSSLSEWLLGLKIIVL